MAASFRYMAFSLAAVLVSTPTLAERYECIAEKKFACSVENGCQPLQIDTWFFVDLDAQTYSRCDRKGCDVHSVKVEYSGVYLITYRPGMMLKMLSSSGAEQLNEINKAMTETGQKLPPQAKSTFVDVATLGTTALTSLGLCRPNK